MSGAAYIDASAFVKLFAAEPESEAMTIAIAVEWQQMVASEILAVEAFRAAVRVGAGAPAHATRLLRMVALLPFSAEVRAASCRVGRPELRSLDAIHLATALSVSDQIAAVVTYDDRLSSACADAGLRVLAPA